MSKTISFVASDELAEYLENEAEKRMTTISSTAQMLLAEKVRESSESSEGGVFDRHSDKWYRPNGKHEYAVRRPDGPTKYYKTRRGAAQRLRDEYE